MRFVDEQNGLKMRFMSSVLPDFLSWMMLRDLT